MKTFYETITSLDFWVNLLNSYKNIGPLAPIFLAFIESVIPALPLIGIVGINIASYGPILGFIYSWIGTCLGSITMFSFYRYLIKPHIESFLNRKEHLRRSLERINNSKPVVLFVLALLPFTPSSLINLIYGLSDYQKRVFIPIILAAKAIMVLTLSLFGHSITLADKAPYYLIAVCILLIVLYFISRNISNKYFKK